MSIDEDIICRLKNAFKEKKLTLYLGAGVSVANGLPSWEQLVLAMYFYTLSKETSERRFRPYPNYLFAIAEWHLERLHEPLDITARKIRYHYKDDNEFLKNLKQTLYSGFTYPEDNYIQRPHNMLEVNSTLNSVTELCDYRAAGVKGVQAIVSYNYDNLLEMALKTKRVKYQSVWKATEEQIPKNHLPIYHVHGLIPLAGKGSEPDEIIFTEEQYHLASQDAYSWSNLVQIQCMSASTGLMIGLSLTDRNMRRLLDAIRKTPLSSENYVLLQRNKWTPPKSKDMKLIDKKARTYFERFEQSGIKTVMGEREKQIKRIIDRVEEYDEKIEEKVLKQLGVTPLWYEGHTEIPEIINEIIRRE